MHTMKFYVASARLDTNNNGDEISSIYGTVAVNASPHRTRSGLTMYRTRV